MKQRNSLLMSAVLGFGISLTPLMAQEPPAQQTPPISQPQTQVWSGDLLDAGCRLNSPSDKCEVTETTRLFGLQTADGKYFRFDGDSNGKVMTALQSGKKKTGAIKVSVNGTMSGDTLKAEAIEIR